MGLTPANCAAPKKRLGHSSKSHKAPWISGCRSVAGNDLNRANGLTAVGTAIGQEDAVAIASHGEFQSPSPTENCKLVLAKTERAILLAVGRSGMVGANRRHPYSLFELKDTLAPIHQCGRPKQRRLYACAGRHSCDQVLPGNPVKVTAEAGALGHDQPVQFCGGQPICSRHAPEPRREEFIRERSRPPRPGSPSHHRHTCPRPLERRWEREIEGATLAGRGTRQPQPESTP